MRIAAPPIRTRGPAAGAMLIAVLVAAPLAGWAKCLSYEPNQVELSGTIASQEAFGPPGYGEDPKNDRRESYLVLTIPAAICVDPKTSSNTDDVSESGVTDVQLVYGAPYPFRHAWLNHAVVVRGTLFHAFTGHHRTKVLLQVQNTYINPSTH